MKSLQHSPSRATRRRGLRALAAAAVGAALVLTGCSSGAAPDTSGSSETDSQGGTLTVGVMQDVGKFDPIFSNLPTYNQFAYATPVYETAEGEFTPYLAESWEFSEDNTSVEFTLRGDAVFSDGTAVDAQAVNDSITRFLTTPSPKLQQFGGYIAGVEATGDDTVKVSFKNAVPQSYALGLFAQDSALGMITAPAGTADPDSLVDATNGAGPYVLDTERSISGTEYVFVPNPEFFAPETTTYDTVVIKPFSDPSALASAVTTGQVTYAVSLLPPLAAQAEVAGLQLSTGARGLGDSGTVMLVFGSRTEGPLADERVRQAIAYAMPRDDLNSSLFAGFGTPTSSATPEGLPGYRGEDPYPYDLDKAKALLAEAGYADGFDLTLTSASAMDPGNLIGLAVQGALQAIGINVTLDRNDDPFTALMNKIFTEGGWESYIYTQPGESIFSTVSGGMTGVAPLNPNAEELPASVTGALAEAVAAPADQQNEALTKVTAAVDELQWSVTLQSMPRLTVVQPGVQGVPERYLTPEPNPYSPNPGASWSGN